MDIGFFHPDFGYWQAVAPAVSAEALLATYPDGTIEVPLRPSNDHQWAAAAWVLAVPLPSPADLRAYANVRQWALATGGFTMTIGGVGRTFPTDDIGRSMLAGKVQRLQMADPPASIRWQFGGDVVSLAAADVLAAGLAVDAFIQATFDTLGDVFAAIDAGTVTTTAEVDAWPWPANG